MKKTMATNEQTQAIQKQEPKKLTASERFTNKVISEFTGSVGAITLTNFQKRLAQNYFIAVDVALAAAESKRLVKVTKKQQADPLPVIWDNVNLEPLARNVVAYARIGLDPAQKNHINMVPFKDNAANKYSVAFIEGYRGIELKAMKYGLDVPDAVIVELVYTNDKFKPIKKSMANTYESYDFEIVDAFDRGTIKGGFFYHVYSKAPEKNKLVILTLKDIEKRKPPYASVEFWGGEKSIWKDGRVVGTEHVDGWYEKMCYKTVYRAAYGDITTDSQKIDDAYLRLKQAEQDYAGAEAEAEIDANANKRLVDIDTGEVLDMEPAAETQTEPEAAPEPEQPKKDAAAPKAVKQNTSREGQLPLDGKDPF